ncbi:hypothetical protein GM3708_1094 [Geminocystis sp. NIES-3708]|uniref:hypothetical protein n=1 Tax=Geminocystis sp. NIES-3708 TaxID=1615909 RepID=UPI0005FCCA45|nr:hypothetical protein [Geminocystis sp. NIES-3708]BAQ60688.1 hypothetical protein GM3708_1094 [Geminocystis sp. NIES-3708]
MSIYRPNFFPQNMIFRRQYWRCVNNRQFYLFFLGLTLSVGDIKLILATSIFVGTMLFSYQIKNIPWKNYHRYLTKLLTYQNKQLILSVTTAGTLAIASYIILNIWTEIDNKWLAWGIIWQTMFSTASIAFMSDKLWKKKSIQNHENISSFDELIKLLNSHEPLQRLWAINQIMELCHHNQLTSSEINQIKEYFILLKDLEIEPVIINRLQKSLEKISLTSIQSLKTNTKIYQHLKEKTPVIIDS